ncbi:MAG TPA: UPF0182 family protein [Acidimicrobiales bacterium]|nr:UPF0182 family protein [Acidimicrobiales bacterium]
MRVPTDRPARRGRIPASRIWIIAAAVVLLFLITSLRGIAGFYTDYLWFKELGFTKVWRGVLGSKAALTLIFIGVFFAAMWASLAIAERLAPRFRALGPEDEIVQRYRDVVGPHGGKVRVGISLLFAFIAGGGVSSQWSSFILYRNHVSFGIKDPQFHRDIGFYVFQLPFLKFVVDWLFVAIVIITFITLVAHYLNGGIRLPRSPMERVTPQVKAHMSVLLALLALVKAAGYYLQRYGLANSHRGVVDGASYTDVHAQLPAINLLIFVSLIAVVLFLANIRLQGWLLPGIAVGLWLFLSVVVGGIYPAFVQKVRVVPAENAKERPYIERNIAATRAALGLNKVKTVPFDYREDLDAGGLAANADTIRNLRLWDPKYTKRTFEQDQKLRSYYQLSDLDIDRYVIDGQLTQVLLSARDLDPEGLATQFGSWVNRRLQYTHGFGAVVAPANAVVDGKPNFILKDVPPIGKPEMKQPRVYFGEGLSGFAIVRSNQRELDYQDKGAGGSVYTTYSGTGGVPMGSVIRRAAFALRFGDINPLISNLVTSKSKIVYVRDIRDRVRKAAPFLRYDNDPYPVITSTGRMMWVQDAYTATSAYPYAQRAETDRLDGTAGLKSTFNYVRNSVKIVIDAYDGKMTFYRIDMDDPIAKAYAKAFPTLFTNGDKMPADLTPHLRYPEELFRIQTAMYGRYHISDPGDFFNAGDAWHVAQDPGSGRADATAGSTPVVTLAGPAGQRTPTEGSQSRMDPYYLLTRLPGEKDLNFQILQPFVPASKNDSQKNLTAFMVAKMDPGQYGELQVFEMPRNAQVDGPSLVDNDISSDVNVSQAISLLSQRGSSVILGNLLVIPINNSLLWMRPLYVSSSTTNVPELRKVIVSFAGKVAMRDSLQEALRAVFGDAPATLEQSTGAGTGTPATPAPSASVQQILDQALAAYDAAQAALKSGDLATYQAKIDEFHRLTQQARDESAKQSSPPTTAASRSA